jgi:hypothetical protein
MKITSLLFISLVVGPLLMSCKDDSCEPASEAQAGIDQEVSGTSATLDATEPSSGKGAWSIVSGDGGLIADDKNPKSDFTGNAGVTYILKWTVSGCPTSEDEVQIKFSTDPKLLTVSKSTVINGEVITITGVNFSANFQGMSQIKAVNQADVTKEVFLPIVSRTTTEIKAVMMGTGGGSTGTFKLYYGKKADAGAAIFYESSLMVTVAVPGNAFYTSSTFEASNLSLGGTVAFGTKNGSATLGDYIVKMVSYNFETGASTETAVNTFAIAAGGFGGGAMDKISFTMPNTITAGTYLIKVTYNGVTVTGGWGQYLFVN